VGRRPVGNIRKVPNGYRVRFRRDGKMSTSPEVYETRVNAARALWNLADAGRAESDDDRRYRALVLLATFASLRGGEVIALRRQDLDLNERTVRIRAAYTERSTGELLLGPPKSRAGMRVVEIPEVIVPALREHLAVFVTDDHSHTAAR
jgi:integrase